MARGSKSAGAARSSWEDPEVLSHWVKLAYITMRRQMEAALRETGLSLTQWRALGAISHESGITHTALVTQLEIEAPSVTSLVSGMERKGWITRMRSPSDARVKRLYLTPAGRRKIEIARHEAQAPVEARMAAPLSATQRATLKRLLSTMIDGMR